MQTTITDQIKAVQEAKKYAKSEHHDPLNDAASTLAAIQMLLSGDIGEEFHDFINRPNRSRTDVADDFVAFLIERGLPINK